MTNVQLAPLCHNSITTPRDRSMRGSAAALNKYTLVEKRSNERFCVHVCICTEDIARAENNKESRLILIIIGHVLLLFLSIPRTTLPRALTRPLSLLHSNCLFLQRAQDYIGIYIYIVCIYFLRYGRCADNSFFRRTAPRATFGPTRAL